MKDTLKVFEESAQAYETWREAHPRGFVVNTPRMPTPQLMVLHQADCGRIGDNDTERTGRVYEQAFIRVCATDVEALRAWAREHGSPDGTFTERCPLCLPAMERPRV